MIDESQSRRSHRVVPESVADQVPRRVVIGVFVMTPGVLWIMAMVTEGMNLSSQAGGIGIALMALGAAIIFEGPLVRRAVLGFVFALIVTAVIVWMEAPTRPASATRSTTAGPFRVRALTVTHPLDCKERSDG